MFTKLYSIIILLVFFQFSQAQNDGVMSTVHVSKRTKELRKVTQRIIQYDTALDFEKTPGFVAGMIDEDSTYIIDMGTAEKGTDTRLTDKTIFEIGSLSKVFTASLLSILVEDEVLDYSKSVNELLPDSCYNSNAELITLKDLVMHTSGLPLMPSDFALKEIDPQDPYAYYTKSDLLAFYSTFKFQKSKKYLYSHVNYALIEMIIEHQTQRDFKQLIQEKIFNPLGMKDTHFGINEKLIRRVAPGYMLSGEPSILRTYPAFEGALGIKSTLHDVLIFIRTCMGLVHEEFTPIFSTCFQEKIPIHLQKNVNISYAWHTFQQKKYFDVILHPGRSSGHQISVHFVPETQTGVVIMANSLENLDNLGYLMLALVNKHWKLKRKHRKLWREKYKGRKVQ